MSENKGGRNSFELPNELLERINECSYGGFVLFCFDDKGEPDVYSMVDNNVNATALQYFIRNWGKSIELANIEASKKQLLDEGLDSDENVDGEEGVD